MPTQAIAAYSTELRLGNGVSPGNLPISAATVTAPILITTIPHSIVVGEVTWVVVSGVTGNTAANGSWVAQAASPSTLWLRGSAGNAPYTGGGSALLKDSFVKVAELVNITPIGVSFNMVDASAHDGSGWGTSIPTMKRGVDMRVEINLVPSHVTHNNTTGMIALALGKIRRDWLIVLPDTNKTAIAFQAWVSDHSTVTPVEGVLRSTPVLSIDGEMAWHYA